MTMGATFGGFQGGSPWQGNSFTQNGQTGATTAGGSAGGGPAAPGGGPARVQRWQDNPLAGMSFGFGGATPLSMPTAGPSSIWNEGQIQGRVNAMRAGNDQSAATATQNSAANLGAHGFGGNSPLQQALSSMNSSKALSANTSGENNIRWNAAQGNAQQGLQASMANQQGQNWLNQARLQDTENQMRRQTMLFNAMSNMGGNMYG